MHDLSLPKHDKDYFLALDGWRGICATMVALFHFNAFSHITNSVLVKSGGNFLDFFFVLSGFVIFANYYDRLKIGYPLKDFMLLRFGRLYPLHLFVFLLFIAGDLAQLVFPFLGSGATYAPFEGPGEGPRYIIANLLLIHSFGVTDMLSFNVPSWSISAEFYTYLLFALAIWAGKAKRIVVLVVALVTLIFIFFVPVSMKGTAVLGIVRCIYGFGCGALTWFVFMTLKDRVSSLKPIFFQTLEIALFIGIFFYLHYVVLNFDQLTYLLILSPVIFSVIVFVFAFEKGIFSRILKTPLFALLGMLSYSIYMMHIFISGKIYYGVGHIVQKVTGIQLFSAVNGNDTLGTNIWMGDLICMVYILSVIACSFVTYQLIEVPGRNYFRKLVGRKKLV